MTSNGRQKELEIIQVKKFGIINICLEDHEYKRTKKNLLKATQGVPNKFFTVVTLKRKYIYLFYCVRGGK